MRSLIFLFPIWLAGVQVPLGLHPDSLQQVALLFTIAGALASATAMVYRLGVWRQAMQYVEHNVVAEMARHTSESNRNFARLDERFADIDRFMATVAEQRVTTERWQARIEATLDSVETRVSRIEHAADREAA